MRNKDAAITRRLSDPDFQGRLVGRCLLLTLGMGAVLAVSLVHDAIVWANPQQPKVYVRLDRHAPLQQVAALDSPIVDDSEVLDWAATAVLAPYNVDYHNYPIQLNTASQRFTVHGWNTFASSYIATGNFEKMKQARLLCHAQKQRAAIFGNRPIYRGGVLTYTIQVPIIQTCENVNDNSTTKLMITAVVVRTNEERHPDGLVVDQLVAGPLL